MAASCSEGRIDYEARQSDGRAAHDSGQKGGARLRRAGKLPANIYGHNVESTAITLDAHDFGLLYRHVLPTTIIDLRVDGQTRPVLLAKASASPRTGRSSTSSSSRSTCARRSPPRSPSSASASREMMAQRRRHPAAVARRGHCQRPARRVAGRASRLTCRPSSICTRPSTSRTCRSTARRSRSSRHGDELVFKLTAPQLRDEVSEEQVEADDAAAEGGAAADTAAAE